METIYKKMDINFNNIRKQAVLTLESLVIKLNDSIDEEYKEVNIKAAKIEKDLNDLISLVNTIACVYETNDPDFKDLSNEIRKNPIWFNM